MSKQIRVGDRVRWDACNPNEHRNCRKGKVIAIKDDIASIDIDFYHSVICKVQVCRLIKIN